MVNSKAIVVGINGYERLRPLRYAKEDALKVKMFLEESGEVESVLLFTDDSEPVAGKPTRATRNNLRDLLFTMFEEPFLGPEDNLWFFFSGHGARHDERDYLLPIDANPRYVDDSAITIDFVTQRLSRSGAGNVVLMVDACRNVLGGGRGIGEMGHEAEQRIRERGLISIFACRPEEQSWEEEALKQGIFTFALIKALKEGGCATAWEINSYLKNEVKSLTDKYQKPSQTPWLVAQPIEKANNVLVWNNVKPADLETLKSAAWRQEAEGNFDSALELWTRVNVAAKGRDQDFYAAFKRIEEKRQNRPNIASPISEPAQVALQDASKDRPWENSLRMKFVPVPGTEVLFSIWVTRVQDFSAFVDATNYDATAGMHSLGADGWKQRGATWKNPAFDQGPTHPVVGVNWNDAKAFCDWLTKKEHASGQLPQGKTYRLPMDSEWSAAVALGSESGSTPKEKHARTEGVYPWGHEWPPPPRVGNFAGEEVKGSDWPSDRSVINEYNDGYPHTSPVGSFKANQFGLYDMSGNVWEWCEDWFDETAHARVLRGGSWSQGSGGLLSSYRGSLTPDYRVSSSGFRCVLGTQSSR